MSCIKHIKSIMNLQLKEHEKWMKYALQEAEKAYDVKEVPIGAIVVKEGVIIGRGHNQCESLHDPTAHAEIIAISSATNTLKDWRLTDCSLYVTKEPCFMCSGALMNSRMKFVGFGIYDEQEGCCGSVYQICKDSRFKHQVLVKGGILEESCKYLIKNFFINCRS